MRSRHGDRLARLETFWKAEAVLDQAPSLVDDVLALVEIAKAARDIPDMDTPETDALYRALARLGSGADEEDA